MFAAANRWVRGGPVVDGLFVVTELVQDSCMLDENHLEGWVGMGPDSQASGDATALRISSVFVGDWG